ncbi:MAG: squalene synthase HpnC, partial [Rhodospirillales bacterium]
QSPDVASGKDEAYENFPVGSFLLPAALRPAIAAYYAFARETDDIADSPALSADEKVDWLARFDAVVAGTSDDPACASALALRVRLAEHDISDRHARDLLIAFTRDARKTRYTGWDDVIDYCLHSASPVGRFLLDLHGEDPADYVASDALCNALQVINHLQDCRADYLELDRVYLPESWLTAGGGNIESLGRDQASPALRQAIDRTLDHTEELMTIARTLPGRLTSRRLAMESAAIVRIADRLIGHLRRRDPLRERVKLSKPEYLYCMVCGVFAVLLKKG